MKIKLKLFGIGILMLCLIGVYSCTKEDESSHTSPHEATQSPKTGTITLLNNIDFDHNTRLNNILAEVKLRGANIHIDTLNRIYTEEFKYELNLMSSDPFYSIYSDINNLHVANLVLGQEIYLGNRMDISGLPVDLRQYINSVLNTIPGYLQTELKNTYDDMKSGVINPSNYQAQFLRRFTALENLAASPEERLMIEAYYLVGQDSYEFWMPVALGGFGGYDEYKAFKSYSEFDDYNLPGMNDNDWPNEAPFPKEAGLDILGAVAGCCKWWQMLAGAVGASAA